MQIISIGDNRVGEKFSLECILNRLDIVDRSSHTVSFHWILSGSNASTSITMNTSGSHLTFDPLQASHKGNVTCQATVANIATVNSSYMVTVKGENKKQILL